jgi:hypothetical protein
MEAASYTIPQWCAAYHISRGHYYALKERGLAPRELRLGRRVIITRRAADEWELRMYEQVEHEQPFVDLGS